MQSMPLSGTPVKGKPETPGRFQTPRCHTAKTVDIGALQLGQLLRLLNHRHGDTMPDDAYGRDALFALLTYRVRVATGNPVRRLKSTIAEWAPWLPEQDRDELVARVMRKRFRFGAEKLGNLLKLTDAERTALRLWNIAAIDQPPPEEIARRRQQRYRRSIGVMPRDEYIASVRKSPEEKRAAARERLRRHREMKRGSQTDNTTPIGGTGHTCVSPSVSAPKPSVRRKPRNKQSMVSISCDRDACSDAGVANARAGEVGSGLMEVRP